MTLREIAGEYGLSQSALDRHRDHVVAAVKRTVERREIERDRAIASVWRERLEGAYGATQHGIEIAFQDPKQWPAGAKFIMAAAKLIETGLRVDGVIGENAQSTVTTTTEQVLILPTKRSIETTCEEIEPAE